MTREQIMLDVQEVFQEVFDDDTLVLKDELGTDDIEEWDSLEHINLILQLESRFDIKFTMEEAVVLGMVGDIVDTIYDKL